jgi:hypothetical protein
MEEHGNKSFIQSIPILPGGILINADDDDSWCEEKKYCHSCVAPTMHSQPGPCIRVIFKACTIDPTAMALTLLTPHQ